MNDKTPMERGGMAEGAARVFTAQNEGTGGIPAGLGNKTEGRTSSDESATAWNNKDEPPRATRPPGGSLVVKHGRIARTRERC